MRKIVTFPPVAQDRIRNIGAQIEGMQAQLQQFIDGLIIGAGVNVQTHDISVDLSSMTAAITPKSEGESSSPQE